MFIIQKGKRVCMYVCMEPGHLPEWTMTENVFKLISANSNPNSTLILTLILILTLTYPNPKAQKRFRKNEMTSFFGQVSRYHV